MLSVLAGIPVAVTNALATRLPAGKGRSTNSATIGMLEIGCAKMSKDFLLNNLEVKEN